MWDLSYYFSTTEDFLNYFYIDSFVIYFIIDSMLRFLIFHGDWNSYFPMSRKLFRILSEYPPVHAYYSMLEAFHLANYFNVKYDGSKAVSFSMVIF